MTNHSLHDSPNFRYWAFISYSSKDKGWAKWIHAEIENYGIPTHLINHPMPTGDPVPKRLKPLFRDRDELAASADLGEAIEKALRESRYLIIVCSKNSATSTWVNKEIEIFRNLGREAFIFAMIVDGEPNSGDPNECYPPLLRKFEPLAADARPEADGKHDALLKILAGMLGVGFDTLKQRDTRRRIKRLQWITSLSLIILAMFAALGIFSLYQRNQAIAARDDALDQKAFADALLRENIRQLQSTKNQNQLFSQLLQSKQTTLKEALIQSPKDVSTEDSLALAGFHLQRGLALLELEEFEAAEPILRRALELYRVVQSKPSRISSYTEHGKVDITVPNQFIGGDELARTLISLAEVQYARRFYAEAEQLALEATQLYTSEERKILEAGPLAIASSFLILGQAYTANEKYSEALAAYSRSVALVEETWDLAPKLDAYQRRTLGLLTIESVSAKMASLLRESKVDLSAEAATKLESLVRNSDQNTPFLKGRAYLQLAVVNMKNGQPKVAATWFLKAKDAFEDRYDEDKEGYIEFLEYYKDFLLEQAKDDAVIELFEWDLASIRENNPRDETSRFRTHAYLGIAFFLRSRADDSTTDRMNAIANLRSAFELKNVDFGALAEIKTVFNIYLELLDSEIQLLATNGAFKDCQATLQEKLTVLLRQEQPNTKALFDCFLNLGGLHEQNKEAKEQELALRSAVDLGKQIWPSGSKELALAMDNLGSCLRDQRRFDEAEIFQLTALNMFKENADSDDLNLVISHRNLGALRAGQRDYGSAELYLAKANELASKLLEKDNPISLQIQLELAQVYYVEGSLERSREVLLALVKNVGLTPSEEVSGFKDAANDLLEQIALKEKNQSTEPSK